MPPIGVVEWYLSSSSDNCVVGVACSRECCPPCYPSIHDAALELPSSGLWPPGGLRVPLLHSHKSFHVPLSALISSFYNCLNTWISFSLKRDVHQVETIPAFSSRSPPGLVWGQQTVCSAKMCWVDEVLRKRSHFLSQRLFCCSILNVTRCLFLLFTLFSNEVKGSSGQYSWRCGKIWLRLRSGFSLQFCQKDLVQCWVIHFYFLDLYKTMGWGKVWNCKMVAHGLCQHAMLGLHSIF